MNHLSEEQIIDVLMDEPHEPALEKHLAACDICNERYRTLELGLNAARESKPAIPLMPVPRLSYNKFRQRSLSTRLAWLAAAAALLLSFSGFRMEIGNGEGVAISFGLPGLVSNADSSRFAEMEKALASLENRQLFNDRRVVDLGVNFTNFKEENNDNFGNVGDTIYGMNMMLAQNMNVRDKESLEDKRSKGILKKEGPIQ